MIVDDSVDNSGLVNAKVVIYRDEKDENFKIMG
jgi:hypothetical protein